MERELRLAARKRGAGLRRVHASPFAIQKRNPTPKRATPARTPSRNTRNASQNQQITTEKTPVSRRRSAQRTSTLARRKSERATIATPKLPPPRATPKSTSRRSSLKRRVVESESETETQEIRPEEQIESEDEAEEPQRPVERQSRNRGRRSDSGRSLNPVLEEFETAETAEVEIDSQDSDNSSEASEDVQSQSDNDRESPASPQPSERRTTSHRITKPSKGNRQSTKRLKRSTTNSKTLSLAMKRLSHTPARATPLDVLIQIFDEYLSSQPRSAYTPLISTLRSNLLNQLSLLLDLHFSNQDLANSIKQSARKKSQLRDELFEVRNERTECLREIEKVRGELRNVQSTSFSYDEVLSVLDEETEEIDELGDDISTESSVQEILDKYENLQSVVGTYGAQETIQSLIRTLQKINKKLSV